MLNKISYSAITTVIENFKKYGNAEATDFYLINTDYFWCNIEISRVNDLETSSIKNADY
jgi:hypothetical protein